MNLQLRLAPLLAASLVALGWPGAARAAGARPTVVSASLDVQRTPSADVTASLNRHLRGLLMKEPGVLTPTPSVWEAAIAQLRRQDCDVSDECLQQLALLSGSLYAVYASVELDLTRTHLTAIGRIVRRDGALVEVKGQRGFTAEAAIGNQPFEAVARQVLAKLVAQMELASLPPTVPVAEGRPPPQVGPVSGVPAGPSEPSAKEPGEAHPAAPSEPVAPAASVEQRSPGGGSGLLGKVLFGAGAALLVGGGVLAALGQAQAGNLHPVGGNLPASELDAYHQAVTLRPAGLAIGGAGLACVAAGLWLWLSSGSSSAQASLSPLADGFLLGWSGRW